VAGAKKGGGGDEKGKKREKGREFAAAIVGRNEQRGVLIAGVPYPLSPILLPFSLSLTSCTRGETELRTACKTIHIFLFISRIP